MKSSAHAAHRTAAPVGSRRRVLAGLAATGAALLLAAPARAAAPLAGSLTAKKVAGGKVRTTVTAQVALPGLNWSGTLGSWDVPEGGQRQVTVQPPGMPVPFELRLQHLAQGQFMSMLLMLKMMQQQQPLQVSRSVKVA